MSHTCSIRSFLAQSTGSTFKSIPMVQVTVNSSKQSRFNKELLPTCASPVGHSKERALP
eukprot:CAMPEP_0204133920 /NCGR_PEP_ID=MMETSP0361-20130328/15373_1 /ASSEMBLY_ACC=CAM_ASM_000343 /TAXON_ID=268821 /ORGANISM="Scrippsiella Hangoei, Strain SHTV-5" /LENGTH=58 /DNA_ID=CAMNT_0051087039 /DNA_START=518 /DNA_END=694 /DNA_ORIENTATION=-